MPKPAKISSFNIDQKTWDELKHLAGHVMVIDVPSSDSAEFIEWMSKMTNEVSFGEKKKEVYAKDFVIHNKLTGAFPLKITHNVNGSATIFLSYDDCTLTID